MDLLGNRDYRTLARKTRLKESDLKEVLDLVSSNWSPDPATASSRVNPST